MSILISRLLTIFSSSSAKIIAEKKHIRKHVRELKLMISEKQKLQEAQAVFNKIESFPEYKSAKTILLYWSKPDELPTHKIVEKWNEEKQIILPTVSGEDLILKRYSGESSMKEGALGIGEPDSDESFDGKIDLVIVPGIAFDKKKNRLGRGKGYYDRFFKNNNPIKIGVGFDIQILERIPSAKFDIGMDKIITQSHTIE